MFQDYIKIKYNEFVKIFKDIDSKAIFKVSPWEINKMGYGESFTISNGQYIEKAGMGISFVSNNITSDIAKALKVDFNNKDLKYQACGISIIIHPINPHVPTFHFNSRYIKILDNSKVINSWFGGGMDLTPYILYEQDAINFHKNIKLELDKYNPDLYYKYKDQCDSYFYTKHRQEHRGIGGIFIDKIDDNNTQSLEIIKGITNISLPNFINIFHKRKLNIYTPEDKEWHLIRRARYVEFNLIYDRGTLFGLKTNGRIESIMMSMPPQASWEYEYSIHNKNNYSIYNKLLQVLKKPVDWVNT